ncbi:MAG: bifunctional nuclease family protein, partial [Thermodesulfobacteriota bacterium]
GIHEASAIAAELEDIQLPRPMTHDLLKSILNKLDINVEKVEVTDLRDNVFYATIYLDHNNNQYQIDARPSDAIAVALRTNAPIFVDKEVVEKSKKIDMRKLSAAGKASQESEESQNQKWLEILDSLTPDDFGRYKM